MEISVTHTETGAKARINKAFELYTDSAELRADIAPEIEFALLHPGYIQSHLLTLYKALKTRRNYKVEIPRELLREITESPKDAIH